MLVVRTSTANFVDLIIHTIRAPLLGGVVAIFGVHLSNVGMDAVVIGHVIVGQTQ
jgi:hypothetical protein